MSRVLLIETDEDNLTHTSSILTIAGHRVYTAKTGIEAVDSVHRMKPDIIISETKLPGIDGYGILHLLQKNPKTENIPFIFITSESTRACHRKAVETGADDFLTKPYEESELLNAIEAILKKRERLKNHFLSDNNSVISDYTAALNELLEKSIQNDYRTKELLFSNGNYPQYLMYVKSGMIKGYKTNEEGKELIVQLYGPGDFIGYIPLLENNSYQFSARALKDSEVLLISKNLFFQLIQTNAAFSLEVIKVLAKHNSQKAEQMVRLAYNSLRKRVAQSLLLLKNKYADDTDDFSIQITREELANISGTTTESLIRTLSDFKSEKLISVKGRSIHILEEEKLKNLPN